MILKKDATSIIIEWISKDCLWWKELGKHQILCSAQGGKKRENIYKGREKGIKKRNNRDRKLL